MSKKHYSIPFKKESVALLNVLNEKGEVKYNGEVINNVRDLCLNLDISSYSLYKWRDSFTNIKNSLNEKEQEKAKVFFDTSIIEEEIKKDSENGNNDVKQEDIFGIRFYSWLAKNHGIKGYSRMKLKQLKVALGLALIKDSGLVNTQKDYDKEDYDNLRWGEF